MSDIETIRESLQRGYHPQGHHPNCTTLADEGCHCYAQAALDRVEELLAELEETLDREHRRIAAALASHDPKEETDGR